jgi:hypothetical protein
MKKLSQKGRKLLRIVYQGLGAVALLFGFQGCYLLENLLPAPAYGMPVEYGPGPGWDNVAIHGTVKSKNTDFSIQGIKVSVKDLYSGSLTGENGNFRIYVPEQESYELKFEDVDGPDNGSFKTQEKEIALSDTDAALEIQLEEADEE